MVFKQSKQNKEEWQLLYDQFRNLQKERDALQARLDKFHSVLNTHHDSYYKGDCEYCKLLREDYEAEES